MWLNDQTLKGNYPMIGLSCSQLIKKVFWKSSEIVNMVEENWELDTEFRSFMYPRPDFHISGIKSSKQEDPRFQRECSS
jgi:hypothetical protein